MVSVKEKVLPDSVLPVYPTPIKTFRHTSHFFEFKISFYLIYWIFNRVYLFDTQFFVSIRVLIELYKLNI